MKHGAGNGRLAGKVCVITGTGGSMGRATALMFAREGARVVGCDVSESAAQLTVECVRESGGEMVSLQPCDLTRNEDCQRLVDFAVGTYGQIDVLFNNAAMAYFAPMDTITDEEWYKTIDHELNLVFLMTRAAWPELAKRSGVVVNTASCAAYQTYPILPALAHTAAKGAIVSLTRQLALEGRLHGIRANTISPGLIETNQTRALLSDQERAAPMVSKIMTGRVGQPEDVAATALFLASDESAFITGADIRVDGGMTAC